MSASVAVELLPVHKMKIKYLVTNKMELTGDENGFLYMISSHSFLSQENVDRLDVVYERLRSLKDTSDSLDLLKTTNGEPVKFLSLVTLFLLVSGCTVVEDTPTSTSTSVNTGVSTSTSTSVKVGPKYKAPTATELKGCPKAGEYEAFDISFNADRRFLEIMWILGIRTAMRYYDWQGQESIEGKIPRAAELALYKEMGFELAFVFQHNNRPYSTFADTIGQDRYNRDPTEILAQAKKYGQPKDSAIYLGVDSDDHYKDPGKAAVRKYFSKIAQKLRAGGYRVGMYGSGANCLDLVAAGFIDKSAKDGKPLCWIAGSSGWSRTAEVLKSGRYAIKQRVNQACGGRSLDFNKLNTTDIGQWKL